MSTIFTIVFIIALIGLGVGLVKPQLLAKYTKKEMTRKKILTSYGSLALIALILMVATSPDASKVSETKNEPAVSQATGEELKKQQDLVLAFEKQLLDIDKTAQVTISVMEQGFTDLAAGKISVNELYTLVKNARIAADTANNAYRALKVPDGLPKEIEKNLYDAKSSASTGYFTKKQALDAALRYLDDQKPSDLDEYQRKTELANNFILNAAIEIAKAKTSLGIEVK
jgi:hypothetical protein